MNNKEKSKLKCLLATDQSLGMRRKSTSNNGRSINCQENSIARRKTFTKNQKADAAIPRGEGPEPKEVELKPPQNRELKDISNSPSIFRSPKSKQELSSCKSINFDKMLFRTKEDIYKHWNDNQSLSKWEQLGASPKSENFFKIVYGTSNLECAKPKTPIMDKALRSRDFSSQIDTLPGPRTFSAQRAPPETTENKSAKPRRDMNSQYFCADNKLRKPPASNYFAGKPQCLTATFDLTGNQKGRSASRKRNEAMATLLYSTPKDFLGPCK